MSPTSPPPPLRHDAAALALSVAEFLDLARTEQLLPLLARGFENSTGEAPSPAERRSWETSLPALGRVLSHPELSNFTVLLEYTLPLSFGRVDAILLHDTPTGPLAFIVELKAWSSVSMPNGEAGTNFEVRVPGLGLALNPALKAMQYQHALTEFATFAHAVSFRSLAFAYNLPRGVGEAVLLQSEARMYAPDTPIFFEGEELKLKTYILEQLGPGSADIDAPYDPWATPAMFLRGEFSHGKGFLNYLEEYISSTEPVLGSLTGLRVPLPEDQLAVLLAVREALESNKRHLILVRGCAGAGKSLLAVGSVLNAIRAGYRASVTCKNKILREVLEATLPADPIRKRTYADALLKVPNSFGRNSNLDLIACDEAQRLDRYQVRGLDDAARVLLVLYDERQRLHAAEAGDETTFLANVTNRCVQTFTLGTSRRIMEAQTYLPWVERLLYGDGPLPALSAVPNHIRVCSTLSALVADLERLRRTDLPSSGKPSEVALLASFTETDGRGKRPENGIRATSPELRWAMPGGYADFWVKRTRNDLMRCASVYGCQGLEADYLGLVWGKDLVIRDGRWAIHEKHTITDYLGEPNSLKDLAASKRAEDRTQALELLKNRYYILLTRAAMGTLIYFEDAETGRWWQREKA